MTRSHFSEANPPEFVEYMGQKYRLKKAALPAKSAEQKMGQVERAMTRLEQQGYPANLTPKLQKDWTINPDDLLESVDNLDSTPYLIMWNPITSELLFTSDADVNAPAHVFLHHRHKNTVTKYADAGYDDWIRGVYDSSKNEVAIYKWEPLSRYMMFLDSRMRRHADRLQREGTQAFKRMLEMHGAGSHTVRMKSANR